MSADLEVVASLGTDAVVCVDVLLPDYGPVAVALGEETFRADSLVFLPENGAGTLVRFEPSHGLGHLLASYSNDSRRRQSRKSSVLLSDTDEHGSHGTSRIDRSVFIREVPCPIA